MADGTTVCACDTDYGELFSITCEEYCTYLGGTGTDCNMTTEGAECDCEFDCNDPTAVASQCDAYVYTPCTCAVGDACGWTGDEYCDIEACDEFYPDQDNFDDSATDCAAR